MTGFTSDITDGPVLLRSTGCWPLRAPAAAIMFLPHRGLLSAAPLVTFVTHTVPHGAKSTAPR